MKFKCKTNFEYSGVRSYRRDEVYEFDKGQAGALIQLDPAIRLGALSFFAPLDDAAAGFVKAFKDSAGSAKK
jgi:hypothetical protein